MKTILCVDADSSELSSVKAAAEQAGYEVLTAASGQEGLALCAARHVDGVLLDPRLPDMDGTAFRHQLQRISPDIPLLVYDGADAASMPLRCMDAYLQNPAPPDALLARAAGAVHR
jgi:CheY-like chemotaxis protein